MRKIIFSLITVALLATSSFATACDMTWIVYMGIGNQNYTTCMNTYNSQLDAFPYTPAQQRSIYQDVQSTCVQRLLTERAQFCAWSDSQAVFQQPSCFAAEYWQACAGATTPCTPPIRTYCTSGSGPIAFRSWWQ
jgi:hypothetical protein